MFAVVRPTIVSSSPTLSPPSIESITPEAPTVNVSFSVPPTSASTRVKSTRPSPVPSSSTYPAFVPVICQSLFWLIPVRVSVPAPPVMTSMAEKLSVVFKVPVLSLLNSHSFVIPGPIIVSFPDVPVIERVIFAETVNTSAPEPPTNSSTPLKSTNAPGVAALINWSEFTFQLFWFTASFTPIT